MRGRTATVGSAIALAMLTGLAWAGPSKAPEALPFTLTWVRGACIACKTAVSLADVDFVSTSEAWGIGFMPPGETGEGDYSVVHSADGGKTWREIPEPWQHNESPILSFPSAREGWLKDIDLMAAESRLLWTHDGGAHWRRLPMRDLFVDQMQYLGHGVGYLTSDSPYTKAAYLLGTTDQGAHWRSALLPRGFAPGAMRFTDDGHGVIAGCMDRRPAALRTADSGSHWDVVLFDAPANTTPGDHCDAEPDSLGFSDPRHGWILLSKHSFGLHDRAGFAAAWTTEDGGAHWRQVLRRTENRFEFDDLYFLDAKLGFWMTNDTHSSKLRYTLDGGHAWRVLDLPDTVWACGPDGAGLACAAGFSVLRIVRAAGAFAVAP